MEEVSLSDYNEGSRGMWQRLFPLLALGLAACCLLLLAMTCAALIADGIARTRPSRNPIKGDKAQPVTRSGIYTGRIWHARFQPTRHDFAYPIFYCLIDLDEIDTAMPW